MVSKECDARDLQRNYEERIEELQQLLARCAPQNISLSDRNRTVTISFYTYFVLATLQKYFYKNYMVDLVELFVFVMHSW